MSSNLDPYTAKAENNELTPQEKIDGFKAIVKAAGKTAMLTTHASDGRLHSRAMTPTEWESLRFIFLGNNVSQKFDDIQSDSNVNLSFYDPSSTNWASVTGTASVTKDPVLIKENWGSFMKGYFGDLKDGVHKGDDNDPRISVIEVVPTEIRYWFTTSTKVGQAIETAKGAFMGHAMPPGEIRTINSEEIKLVQGLHLHASAANK